MTRSIAAISVVLVAGQAVCAQSLFQQMVDEPMPMGSRMDLRATSMYLVDPPEPRVFRVHDLVTVIINEISRANTRQTMRTLKEVTQEDTLNGIIDPLKLLQLRLEGGNISALDLLDLEASHEFRSRGTFKRDDQFTTQIAAEVIDVKPNGNLVLQAKKSIVMDGEAKVLVMSGIARQDDITDANTILSTQIADLRVDVQHEGEMRKSSEKGLITRVLETLFNF